ncbi:hypothetical protein LZ30DRAFT_685698 [Colletotrichum cereale]|nr:hypothetical protein LZ30DRAFT_685698 [Colletotrichum cereale]
MSTSRSFFSMEYLTTESPETLENHHQQKIDHSPRPEGGQLNSEEQAVITSQSHIMDPAPEHNKSLIPEDPENLRQMAQGGASLLRQSDDGGYAENSPVDDSNSNDRYLRTDQQRESSPASSDSDSVTIAQRKEISKRPSSSTGSRPHKRLALDSLLTTEKTNFQFHVDAGEFPLFSRSAVLALQPQNDGPQAESGEFSGFSQQAQSTSQPQAESNPFQRPFQRRRTVRLLQPQSGPERFAQNPQMTSNADDLESMTKSLGSIENVTSGLRSYKVSHNRLHKFRAHRNHMRGLTEGMSPFREEERMGHVAEYMFMWNFDPDDRLDIEGYAECCKREGDTLAAPAIKPQTTGLQTTGPQVGFGGFSRYSGAGGFFQQAQPTSRSHSESSQHPESSQSAQSQPQSGPDRFDENRQTASNSDYLEAISMRSSLTAFGNTDSEDEEFADFRRQRRSTRGFMEKIMMFREEERQGHLNEYFAMAGNGGMTFEKYLRGCKKDGDAMAAKPDA